MQYSLFVVGCGATGSNLLPNLAQYAMFEKSIKNIILIDKDIVEEKNFQNQKFSQKDIFKCKSQVLATRYKRLGINIGYVDEYIKSADQLINIFNTYKVTVPILISCVDNNKARRVFNKAFENVDDIIYIDAGNGTKDRVGQVVIGAKEYGKVVAPPVGELFPSILDEKQDDDNDKEEKISYHCAGGIKEHPQNLSTNVLSATVIFLALTNLLSFQKCSKRCYLFNADKISIK